MMNKTTNASLLALLVALGVSSVAAAQTTQPSSAPAPDSQMMKALPDGEVSANAATPTQPQQRPPRPGDRTCLQSTGSLIPPKPGTCLPNHGNSYSRQDILNTGQIDTGRALQQLDPSITISGRH
jgi:hypothetical protein